VTFEKPLFPGYLFLRMPRQSHAVLRAITWQPARRSLQDEFEEKQLKAILEALETDYEVRLVPTIQPGAGSDRSGPLRGMEGYVEHRKGRSRCICASTSSTGSGSASDADLLLV
jgi:hypothetical protein